MIKVLSAAVTVTDTATSITDLLEATTTGLSDEITADNTGAISIDIVAAAGGGDPVVIGNSSIESITAAEVAAGNVPAAGGALILAGEQVELRGNDEGRLDAESIYLITDSTVNCSLNIWH